MEETMKWNRSVLWGFLILSVVCVQSLKAKEISDEEMGNVKGASWSGWICGFCWDACQNLGSESWCESVEDCEGSGSMDQGDACGQLYMSSDTPTETIMWCYSGKTSNQIYCSGQGPYSTCSGWETCRCYDPGVIVGFCEVIWLTMPGDNDNCS